MQAADFFSSGWIDMRWKQTLLGIRRQGQGNTHYAFDAPSGESPMTGGVFAKLVMQIVYSQLRRQARRALLERQLQSRRADRLRVAAVNAQVCPKMTRLAMRVLKAPAAILGYFSRAMQIATPDGENRVFQKELSERGAVATVGKECEVGEELLDHEDVSRIGRH